MAVQDKSTSSFPLVFLQPVADVHYLWTALSLHVSPFDENGCDLFSRLFNEFGLGDALNGLACILTVPNPERFVGECGAPSLAGTSEQAGLWFDRRWPAVAPGLVFRICRIHFAGLQRRYSAGSR